MNRVVAAGACANTTRGCSPVPEATQPIPLVLVDVVAPNPETATKTLELVTAEFSVALENLQHQARVPDEMMVEPFVVSPPGTPVAATPSRTRSTLSILFAGVGLAVVVAVVADALLNRRRRRRTETTTADATSGTALPRNGQTNAAEPETPDPAPEDSPKETTEAR